MSWKRIRLTLARTPQFPVGSSDYRYELTLPLREDGLIDFAAFEMMPGRATVMYHSPMRGTQRGAILKEGRRFVFSFEPGDADDEEIFHLEDHRLREREYITVTQPDGEALPFQVDCVLSLPNGSYPPNHSHATWDDGSNL